MFRMRAQITKEPVVKISPLYLDRKVGLYTNYQVFKIKRPPLYSQKIRFDGGGRALTFTPFLTPFFHLVLRLLGFAQKSYKT